MYVSVRQRLLLLLLTIVALTLPVLADDVTISGNVNFSSLDGSSLDHDGASNGVFTVDDGNLTVLGSISCNDDGAGNNHACPMSFAVSGDFTMAPGSALYAENRKGGGNGGNLTFNVGGNVSLQSSGPSFTNGAVISSGNEGVGLGGDITFNVGGNSTFAGGTIVSASSKGGAAGDILVQGEGSISANGLIASGPTRNLTATRLTAEVVSGGSSGAAGGTVTLRATTSSEPGVVVGANATIVSQGENGGSGRVLVEGCGIEIRGLVASISRGSGSAVSVRSGTTILVDMTGMLRADSMHDSAAGNPLDLFAGAGIQINGPSAASPYFALNSNPGGNNGTGGTIRVIALDGTVTASGNAFRAGSTANNSKGGSINVSASSSVNLNGATAQANGATGGKGGSINVRSYSANVSWQTGVGDARPTGSSIAAANRGTITLTYCTSVSTTGSSFPTNGSPVGTYPATVNSCSPAAPSLPAGESALPICNEPPIANNDAYNVNEGGTLNVPAPGVLGNDSDPNGDPITAILVSGPAHATSFALNANGSFSYTHDGSETLTDSFTYKASDGSLDSNIATVNIIITPVNDAPVANNDGPYNVNEGGTINFAAPGVLANDTDPDGPTMSAVLVSGPAHASAFALNANGSWSYTHDGSETTTDSFTYQVFDGVTSSNVATVSITITPVNDAPVANNDGPYNVNEGGSFTLPAPGVLGNDTDAEGNSLTAVLVSGPAHATSFTLNADGSFSYQHDGSETTSDSFTYRANDGAANSNIATVTITITPVNDAPVANNDGPYNVNEGGTISFPAPGVLANDTDADGPSMSAVLVSGPAHASSFTLNADGSWSYTHDGSETTTDSFTYQVSDGSALSNVATVSITITPVNDAPVANNDGPYAVTEGGTFNLPAPGVLANDTDAENDSLTAILVSGPAHAANFTFNADGSFTYEHDGGEDLTDSFTYKVNDGSADSNVATVSITITPVNDVPVANDDGPYNVLEGGSITVPAPGVLGNDNDPDGPVMNAVLVSGPANASFFVLNPNGSFTYTHNGTETTSDSFTYRINDGSALSNIATVTISITLVNDVPSAGPDAYLGVGNTELRVGTGAAAHPAAVVSGSVLANDADNDGPGPLSVTAFDATSANGGTVTMLPNGTFNYLPPVGYTGIDTFNYTVSDGAASAVGTVTITLTDRVWYVNPAGAGPQTGRSTEPFLTIGQAQAASSVNDYIHVAQGAQATGILLKNGQRLIGSGVALVVGPYTLAAATTRPTLGSTVILANGNLVTGLNVSGLGVGINGTNVNNGTIAEVGISGGSDGLTLTNPTGAFTLTNVSIAPGANGLTLSGGSANVTANNVTVVTTLGTGITANGTGTLAFNGGSVASTNNTAVNITNQTLGGSGLISVSSSNTVNGISLANTLGTFTVAGTGAAGSGGTITNTTGAGVSLLNSSASLNSMIIQNSATQGVVFSNNVVGPARSLTVNGSTIQNNFSTGVIVGNDVSSAVAVTVSNNTFTTNAGSVTFLTTNAGNADVDVTGNVSTFNNGNAFTFQRSATATGNVDLTFTGNTIGATGVVGSGAACGGGCSGVTVFALGSGGTLNGLISNNTIRQVDLIGIRARSGQGNAAMNLTITNNVISEAVAGATNGINVQSGTLSADTNATCALITGNTVTGGYAPAIHVRNNTTSAGTTFSLPGYAGLGTDLTAVANYLIANNTITTATAARKTSAPQNQFSGGAPCATPAP